MKRFSISSGIALAAIALSLVLLPAPAPAAVHARADTLLPVKFGLPFAKSGQPYLYSVAGAATGGTKPYRCTPQVLHVGSLKLGSNCKIAGIAPVVDIKSITGPFVFKLTDSAKPPKTVNLYPLNFTTIAPAKQAASPYNGSYDGTIATTFAGSNTAHSVAFQFTVAQGVIRDFAKGNFPYPFSSPTIVNGQASMVLKAPDGSLNGTLFFVMSANGGVAVHGTLTGTIGGSALSDVVTARRTYPR